MSKNSDFTSGLSYAAKLITDRMAVSCGGPVAIEELRKVRATILNTAIEVDLIDTWIYKNVRK